MRAHQSFHPAPQAVRVAGLLLGLFVANGAPAGEVEYTGTLGAQPIRLFANIYGDGVVHAIYAYDRHDTPIRIDGRLVDGELALAERDERENVTATLRFAEFSEAQADLHGAWRGSAGARQLPITLHRAFPVAPDNVAPERAVLQAAASRDEYFMLVSDGAADSWSTRAVELRVFRKGSDRLLQSIALDSEWRGIDSVLVGDYNFDGVDDISVFEGSFAGPNTSSRYFLRDGAKYVDSGWSGVSLEFDATAKLIREHNQCCAGRSHVNTTYKVVANRMVEVEQTCLEWDDAKEDLVAVECSE